MNFPTYFKCTSALHFDQMNSLAAAEFTKITGEQCDKYALPSIDKHGNYYLIINSDIAGILSESELANCVEFSEIPLSQPTL